MLKENIEHKEGMPVDQFKLIYMGQQMDEMKKLLDYKISAGSYIIMVPSLRGGWALLICKHHIAKIFIIYFYLFMCLFYVESKASFNKIVLSYWWEYFK